MKTMAQPHRQSRQRLRIGATTLIALVAACALAAGARAEPAAPSKADLLAGGALILKGKGVADAIPAVRLGSDMQVTVSGQVVRVRVTQAFRNTSDGWMEATYLYPLPDDGAVDTMRMVVGQRVFTGRIKRREEARAAYDKAREEGRQAGLVESERPNLFRSSVANVGPRETVVIAIEYQAPVRQLGGEYALRLPLVAGPRYVPPHTLVDGAGALDAEAVEDAGAVSAPLAAPWLGTSLNPVTITVRLAPGFRPANVISPYHRIAVRETGAEERLVTLAEGEVPADRDFELRWRSASADPAIGLFHEALAGEHYVMATITPPASVAAETTAPREMVFVIDNSGSMGGTSMQAAKESLLHALDTLRPQDSFNVIRFDDTMTMLFDHAMPASAEQVDLARRFTQGLEAAGGTEMLPALKAALVDAEPGTATLRQVVFLTDGDLSNEREMMAEIAANGGRSRVFMVGIGSAPNAFLMRRMAETGRGTYTNIGVEGEVTAKMAALLDRLRAPSVHDLTVETEGSAIALVPVRLPDLYAGEPLVLLGKGAAPGGRLTVRGLIGDKPWKATLDLARASESPAIARLWANRAIADIEARRWSNEIEGDLADAQVAEIGLAYSLVTSQTSLVAEDNTPARPAGARLRQEELPLLLPAGWDFDALFGRDPLNDPAAAGAADATQEEAVPLPQTATGFAGGLSRGLALLAAGLLGLFATRRRKPVHR